MRSQAPAVTDDEVSGRRAADRAAGGRVSVGPKLLHLGSAFCRTRTAARWAASPPARRANPSRCARGPNPRPLAASERSVAHPRYSARSTRSASPHGPRSTPLHPPSVGLRLQVSSSSRTRSSGFGAPRRCLLSQRRCCAPFLCLRACERRATGFGGPFGCVAGVSRGVRGVCGSGTRGG